MRVVVWVRVICARILLTFDIACVSIACHVQHELNRERRRAYPYPSQVRTGEYTCDLTRGRAAVRISTS